MTDSMPYDNLEELALLLHNTFKGNDAGAKQASKALFEMSKNFVRFAESLGRLITSDQSDNQILNVKSSACLMLGTYISDLKKQEDFIPIKGLVLEAVLEMMFSRNVVLALKMHLQKALEELYSVDSTRELRYKSLVLVKEKLANGPVDDYSAAFLTIQNIIGVPRTPKSIIEEWFELIKEELTLSGANLVTGIMDQIKKGLGSSDSVDRFSHVFMGLKILRIWASVVHSFIFKLGREIKNKKYDPMFVKTVLSYEPLAEVLAKVLTLQVQTQKQLPQCIFSVSGVTGIDQAMNSAKTNVLRCLNKGLKYASLSSALLNPDNNKLFAFACNVGLQGILESVLSFCENPEEALQDQDLEDCLVETLTFLTHLVSKKDLYPIFSSCAHRLLMNVCLPLMRTSKVELEKFEFDPEEFVNIGIDVCTQQESLIAKTEAAKLLEAICDNIDGASTFLVKALINIMEHTLIHGHNNQQAIVEHYPNLQEFKDGLFLARTEAVIRIETSVLAMATLSYIIVNREDLLEILEKFLEQFKDFFYTDKSDPLIRCRMCLFIGEYFDIVFRKQAAKDLYPLQLIFLINCMQITDKNLYPLSHQAVETLANIFEVQVNRPRLGPLLEEIIPKIAPYSQVAKDSSFFKIINEIFSHFKKRLLGNPALIGHLIDGLVKRLMITYANGKPGKSEGLIASQIWNIIIEVAGNSRFIPQFQDDIEKIMEPLFVAFENNNDVPYEGQILFYVETVIRTSKQVSAVCWGVLKNFIKLFVKFHHLLTTLLPSLNQFIIYGKDTLSKEPESVRALIQMGIQGLTPSHDKATDVAICEAALLLQLIVQYLGGISNEQWENIIIACLEKLRTTQKTYVQIKLGGVFLSAFLANFELTWAILENQRVMPDLMNLYLDEASSFEYAYDRKLLIMGLCSFIAKGLRSPVINERIFQIFNVLISFLKYQEMSEQKKAQWKAENQDTNDDDEEEVKFIRTPKDVLEGFLKSENKEQMENNLERESMGMATDGQDNEYEDVKEDDNDKEYLEDSEEHELKELMEAFESGVDNQDEFALFKETVFAIKQAYEEALRTIIEKLHDNKKEYLRAIFLSQRVVVKEKDGVAETEARKIVKVKARKIADVNMNNDKE